jgi:hypothetical protein
MHYLQQTAILPQPKNRRPIFAKHLIWKKKLPTFMGQ